MLNISEGHQKFTSLCLHKGPYPHADYCCIGMIHQWMQIVKSEGHGEGHKVEMTEMGQAPETWDDMGGGGGVGAGGRGRLHPTKPPPPSHHPPLTSNMTMYHHTIPYTHPYGPPLFSLL